MPVGSAEVFWAKRAREDYAYWRRRNSRTAKRIDDLIGDIKRNPFTGPGKPEPLKHDLTGYWSRRITKEDRLVYRVEGGVIYIAQCRLHYDKR